MTTASIYNDFKNKLKTIYDDREADNISDWIFENVTGLKRWERRGNQNKEVNETDSEKLKKYLIIYLYSVTSPYFTCAKHTVHEVKITFNR